MAIISASRRTDLPAAHADWLYRRFREEFVLVRNPMNPRAVQRVSLRPEDVDGIVFWSKNPRPMIARLGELEAYVYYFQYTLTAYGRDAEAYLPSHEERIETFRELAERIGAERVVWRYDPILVTEQYSPGWHVEAFQRLAEALRGYSRRVTISFVDTYARNRKRLAELGVLPVEMQEMRDLARRLSDIARENGMETAACCEAIDFSDCGVGRAKCVDAELLGRIGGVPLRAVKDPNQREHCGCAPSVDIGAYNTCPNGCAYCYANYSPALLRANLAQCDAVSPLLCGRLADGDVVRERRMPSMRERQIRMEFQERT